MLGLGVFWVKVLRIIILRHYQNSFLKETLAFARTIVD